MKLEKPTTKWKPDLSGKTTGESRLPFFYGVLGLLAVTLVLFLPAWIGKGGSLLDLTQVGVLIYISHYWMVGVFVYLYVYSLKRDHLSAGLAGVIFMTSGFLIGHLLDLEILYAVVWLPLALFFLEKLDSYLVAAGV